MDKILKKGLIVGTICLLMLVSIPTAIGKEDFNLVVKINPVRKIFPRIYIQGADKDFEIFISNEGPTNCSGSTVELTYFALLGYKPGELKRDKIEIGAIPANGNHSEIIHCGSLTPVGLFVIYKLQATINIDDLKQNDNNASLIFIVLGR